MGFYISPPPGKDWYEKHQQESLLYFKNTKGTSYLISTQATELFFENKEDLTQEILDYIAEHKTQPADDGNFRNTDFSYGFEEMEASLCIRYQLSYDDYGNEKKGPYPYVRIFNKGLVCRHPQSPKVGIDIGYVEKSFPDVSVRPSLRNEGELFISSLNFFRPSNLNSL